VNLTIPHYLIFLIKRDIYLLHNFKATGLFFKKNLSWLNKLNAYLNLTIPHYLKL